ncbi:hypothetical protein PFISCL1PPCAC_5138, partial [Pristionchus fissidentatus]
CCEQVSCKTQHRLSQQLRRRTEETDPSPPITTTESDLDVGGVQHNADALSHSGRGQVSVELSADGSGVSVRTGDLSPNAANAACGGSGDVSLVVCLVDVDDALSDVPGGVSLVVDTVELQDRGSLGLVALTAGESREDGLDVKSTK